MRSTSRSWGVTWMALTISFALHVWDEAAHGFLPIYNRNVEAIRSRWPSMPLPAFTLGEVLFGLSAAIVLMAVLTPLAFRGTPWLKIVAYPYGGIMLVNALQHMAVSLIVGRPMPGVLSSPLLLLTSAALLAATRRVGLPAAGPLAENGAGRGKG